MNDVIDLEWFRLAAAYFFILLLIAIVKWRGISREKEIIIASVRMTLQLILVGYILEYVFAHAHPLYTIVLVLLMLSFAVYTIIKRAKTDLSPSMKGIIALSLTAGILFSLLFFIFVVLNLAPWYEPRYVIPVAGMIIGNSMTGIALGVNTLTEGMRTRKSHVEAALMLGATPREASREIINQAFDSAMMPTIHSMLGMGIVFLPGMMTGQILGGASPAVAIEYQIAVMLGIVGSVSLSVILFVQIGYRSFFNHRKQLQI